jgi:hypothetical protein
MADEAATALLKRIAAGYAINTGKTYAYAKSLCRCRISFAIQPGVACQLSYFVLASSSVAHRVDNAVEMVKLLIIELQRRVDDFRIYR